MSIVSHAEKQYACNENGIINTFGKILKSIASFFRRGSITRSARIYHGSYSYHSLPDTAFYNFASMSDVTFVETGDCYVYIFEEPQYQGNYIIACPREVVPVGKCGSMIVSLDKLPIKQIMEKGTPSGRLWEVSGANYQWHCAMGYKYV